MNINGDLDIWGDQDWNDTMMGYLDSVHKNTLEYNKERSRSRSDIQYDKQ